jgi:hypothetical protein
MAPYGIRAVDDEPHGCPPWIMKVAVVCLILFGVVVVRMVIGLGLAYAYYRSAQNFDAFVTEHPVELAVLDSRVPTGTLLASASPWRLGGLGGGELETASLWCEVDIRHGDEQLLDAMVEVVAAESPGDAESRSLEVSLKRITTDPRLHALIQVGVVENGDLLEAGGEFVVDVALASGPGDDSLRVVELSAVPPVWEDEPPFSLLRLLFGLMHPVSDHPPEGLIYRTRQRLTLDWSGTINEGTRLEGRTVDLKLNCHDYSSSVDASFSTFANGSRQLHQETNWSESYDWNEQVW